MSAKDFYYYSLSTESNNSLTNRINFSNMTVTLQPSSFQSNRRRSSLQCPNQIIENNGIVLNNYLKGSIERVRKNSKKSNRKESDAQKSLLTLPNASAEASCANFLDEKTIQGSSNYNFAIHRRSQPSLLLYQTNCLDENRISPYFRKLGILQHAPSQPILSTNERKYTYYKKNSIQDSTNYKNCNSSNCNNYELQKSFNKQNQFIQNTNFGKIISRRSTPMARATEKRILKRCPQSDLSYRVQRCFINNNKDFGKILPKNLIPLQTNQLLIFQKFDSVNNSNESTPSHSEGFYFNII